MGGWGWRNLHRFFARLHRGKLNESEIAERRPPKDFPSVYAAYAAYAFATVHAHNMLQQHGPHSPEFAQADIASMRLFHRVKKMQGLKKAKAS
jgi:hypothetical protein